ncbi:hypothetical protein GCM10023116_48070 [Kistimonas scapharcae]|uniref:Uncharacterized protein n=1 Tax=Kistimonas scapharcae TaxID=1036133 RepID=A0ABP8VAD7_9GAMM
MRNIITEEKEMILRSRILIRPYWTERLVDKLLGEPDHIHYRKDGKPYASFWCMDKVVEGRGAGAVQGTPQVDRDVEVGGTHVNARECVDEDIESVDLIVMGARWEGQAFGDELV